MSFAGPRPWDKLPSNFRFSVFAATPQKDIVEVFKAINGRAERSGRKIKVAEFAVANMDKVAQIIAKLRTQKKPVIEYISNQFVDIHRSSGRGHVVGAILTNEEAQGDYFDLDKAAKQALANKVGNCDRVNAAAVRMISLFDIKDPVLYYWTVKGNHNVGLVGDPRMPKYGETNTVVVDAHSVFPMPHSLAEAAYEMRIPRATEDGYADLEILDGQENAASLLDSRHLPAPISSAQQREWLHERGWPTRFGVDVVKAWHATEIRETGNVPSRWDYLFSCKDPSVQYSAGAGRLQAYNSFPVEFVRKRVEAFLKLNEIFGADGSPPDSQRDNDVEMLDVGLSNVQPTDYDIRPRAETGLAFQHLTPMNTVVTDLITGEVVLEINGSQIPIDKVNHGFPIKDPQKPYAIHPAYVSSEDCFTCHKNVKVVRVELPPGTKAIMRDYFPVEAAKADYFAKRASEIRAEYEAPLDKQKPPSALQWRAKRLTPKECYSDEQARALAGAFGVVPIDYDNQNVGGMGPVFAGAEIKTAAQRRQYIAQISKAAFDDFSIRAGDPKYPHEGASFAPYGGGNLAQFMNGKFLPEEQAHFIAVDVIIHTINKYGQPRRVVAPHFFQIARVPQGKQAILDYRDDGSYFYRGMRPGMSVQNRLGMDHEIKEEPLDDEMNIDVPMLDARARSDEPQDDDSTSLSSAPPSDVEDPDFEVADAESFASVRKERASRQPPSRTTGGRTDDEIISQLPPGVWETAEAQAKKGKLPTGVTFHEASDKRLNPYYQAHLNQKGVGFFSVTQGRDKFRARALAIATRLAAEAIEGGGQRRDENVIAKFPPDLWEEAQAEALEPSLPTGVQFSNNRYIASIKADGKLKSLGSFSILADRDKTMAKALAIATRKMANLKNSQEEKDQAVIDQFSEGVWEAAQLRANQPGLPRGVSLRPASAKVPDGIYVVNFDNKAHYFSVKKGRDDIKAKSMAIATLTALQNQAGIGDAQIIAKFPLEIWERAKARAENPGQPGGVLFVEASGRTSPFYIARIWRSGKWIKLGHFSVVGDRDNVTAKALAIATRWSAELKDAK